LVSHCVKTTQSPPELKANSGNGDFKTSYLGNGAITPILDVDEAAALLKISKKTAYNRVKENTIRHARLGRKRLFHRQSLVQGIANGANRAC
jgi:excisionase family DNA binding protein